MSGPTKGMVAGKAIVTGALTREYEEGHARTFGERKSAKGGRWRWDAQLQKLVPVGGDYVERCRVPVFGDSHYEGLRSPVDGTDISSRTKHREYLKATGLAMADDFKGVAERARKEREAFYAGQAADVRRDIRETAAREFARVSDLPQARYDREVQHRTITRRARADTFRE